MILLDTHIWVWWVNGSSELPEVIDYLSIRMNKKVWQSTLCPAGRWPIWSRRIVSPSTSLSLDWINLAINYPGMNLFNLTPAIVVDANELP
ncbi:MAG TPA: hypothetical protein VMS31_15935, partial [Pyrinomonadaceae bacterium]|nr:hypothetical protein [Pyrinomonadaceae bacterium]